MGVVNGTTYYDIESNVLVDNVQPNVTLTVPAAPLSGTVNLTATASDANSGVASVRFEYRKVGVASWTTCALDTGSPYSCSLNTAGLSDGNYEFRATATDVAGNTRITATTTRADQQRQRDPGRAPGRDPRHLRADRDLERTGNADR